MANVQKIKNHFEEEAPEFDEIILKLVPHYNEMVNSLVSSIPFAKNDVFKVLDLGCGTGTIGYRIKENFPNATITCLDLAENMITTAKNKLAYFSDVTFIISDFNSFSFNDRYDVIVSSLALHHLATDADKVEFYRKIYKALPDKGTFYNADVVLASNDFLQNMYMEKWKDFMRKSISDKDIDGTWIPISKEGDRPSKLIDQLKWLQEIGFDTVDVIWKYYNFAVYGGRKSSS